MNDGRNVFETNTSSFQKEWKVERVIDQLITDGRMEKVIVIGVDASDGAKRERNMFLFSMSPFRLMARVQRNLPVISLKLSFLMWMELTEPFLIGTIE